MVHEHATAPHARDDGATASTGLTVSGIDDRAEIEAERAADAVVAALRSSSVGVRPGVGRAARIGPTPQANRTATAPTSPAPTEPRVRRAAAVSGVGPDGGSAPAELERGIAATIGRGEPLEHHTRVAMEGAFGADLSRTRIHRNATADRLTRTANARAMTVGQDIYFSRGSFTPSTEDGAHLLAHELAHTVQNTRTAVGLHRSTRIQRKYQEARVDTNAHLRTEKSWDETKGSKITKGTVILAGDTPTRKNEALEMKTKITGLGPKGFKREDVRWTGALLIRPNQLGNPIPDHKAGFIRASSVTFVGTDDVVKDHLIAEIKRKLTEAEQHSPALAGKLLDLTDANHLQQLEFLFDKQLRATGVGGFRPEGEARLLSIMPDRLDRIGKGALEMAKMIEHWRVKLHPTKAKRVTVDSVEYTKSDMHARGLGVIRVKFSKPAGGNQTFPERRVDVMLKPEDKALERELIGADPGDASFKSAATQINELLGIDSDPKQALTTIRMSSDRQWGSIIQRVKGTSPKDLEKGGIAFPPVEQTFYETYVFAVLAGLDDLHEENVMWSDDGRPFLIDADNVLSQRIYQGDTELPQSGFRSQKKSEQTFTDAGTAAKKAADTGDNSAINSKLLAALNKGDATTRAIVAIMKRSLTGQTCRVVPVKTAEWARRVGSYGMMTAAERDERLDTWSSAAELVEATKEGGAGMKGVVGQHPTRPLYDEPKERAELEKDLRSGVIPFYEYDFASGEVSHNGQVVYRGVEAIQAWEAFTKARLNI